MIDHNVIHGVEITSDTSTSPCTGCIIGKSHQLTFTNSTRSQSSKLLSLVHSHVLGPINVPSLDGSRYVITFIDDHSKWTVDYTMHRKSDAFGCFKTYKTYAERHTGRKIYSLHILNDTFPKPKIKILRTDNSGEYLSASFKSYLMQNGISHKLTIAYTPQNNGVAERLNLTLMELVRYMIYHANVHTKFWAESLSTAVYVRNCVTSRGLPPHTTPHDLWHEKPPNLSHLRTFGSEAWYVLPRQKNNKLDAQSRHAILLGYTKNSKG